MRKLTRVLVVLLTTIAIGGLHLPARAATGTIAPFPKHQFFDNSGNPCVGCLLFTYTAGSSSKVSTFSEVTLTTANANPLTLGANGRATVFLTPGVSYKFILAPANDVDPPLSPIWTQDNVSAVPPSSTSADVDVTATAGSTIAAGDAVYWSDGTGGTTVGRVYPMDADNTYSSNLASTVGFATAAISTGASGTVRVSGRITGLTGLVAGTWMYASATAGALTSTKPTNGRLLGIADSTTTLVIFGSHPDASATVSGLVSTGAQTIAGNKTLSGTTSLAATTFTVIPTGAGVPVFSRSTSDTTKNANTTFGDVTGLSFAIAANEVWEFRFVMKGISAAAADFKFTLTGPAAPTAVWFGVSTANLSIGDSAQAAFGSTCTVTSGGFEDKMELSGLIRNGANAGTIQLQFAQLVSDASNSIIRAESFVIARRIS